MRLLMSKPRNIEFNPELTSNEHSTDCAYVTRANISTVLYIH